MSSLIIGTSGHIDHGKTTLLRALTGIHLDRSPEEKKRGITIDLGFTNMTLQNGKEVSFIDVPGHEKLVRTMIAGASGMDAVLLCVSAVEGVMPQTLEHMDILNLLGVQQGVIALTMTDLVDADLLELAELDIADATSGTVFEHFPVIQTAINEASTSLNDLLDAIGALQSREHSVSAPFRLPIDRVFVQSGFGTIVTGTVRGKPITIGDTVFVHPSKQTARVRALQQHGSSIEKTLAGQRTAINLSGVSHQDLQRGQVLIEPETIPASAIVDIDYHHLPNAPELNNGDRVRVLVGSSEYLARIHFYETHLSDKRYAQIRLSEPACTLPSDRIIIRRESPITTLGGGMVIDPWAPKMRQKNRSEQLEALKRLHSGDIKASLERRNTKGMTIREAKLWGIEDVAFDGQLYSESVVDAWRQEAVSFIDAYHLTAPLSFGVPLRELHSQTLNFLSAKAFSVLIEGLIAEKIIKQFGARLARMGFNVELTDNDKAVQEKIQREILSAGLEGLVMPESNLDLIHHLLSTDQLFTIQNRLIHPDVAQNLRHKVTSYFENKELMTPVDFKTISGLSRKHAIPWLEWLDSAGITQRTTKGRVLRAADGNP